MNDELTRLVDGGERLELTLLQVLAVHDKLRPADGRLLTHRTLRFALAAERYFGRPDIRLNLERETIDHIFSEAGRQLTALDEAHPQPNGDVLAVTDQLLSVLNAMRVMVEREALLETQHEKSATPERTSA